MNAAESMKIAVETAAKHLDEIIANDEQNRIGKHRWFSLAQS
jgi:hypothetical protein